ncbi:hypothetical protein [uncultured Polaribacter sp.]|uniref:hypothetical protein n=1 Tax=uncultured Polaribacter sp. TaxID=174711 RepID=UPI0030D827B0|tara:strand:- start:1299 stop:1655 length:357 start_codon:yes stop_codon:yes gene_type:complete
MKIQDLVGKFSVIGSNQDADENAYKGTLFLTLDENDRIIAKWIINKTQHQFGTGFFKNNILVINFNYKGLENKTYNGVVVYKCTNKDILEGFWSEELGDPKFLGSENCFRIQEHKLVN